LSLLSKYRHEHPELLYAPDAEDPHSVGLMAGQSRSNTTEAIADVLDYVKGLVNEWERPAREKKEAQDKALEWIRRNNTQCEELRQRRRKMKEERKMEEEDEHCRRTMEEERRQHRETCQQHGLVEIIPQLQGLLPPAARVSIDAEISASVSPAPSRKRKYEELENENRELKVQLREREEEILKLKASASS
jgi:hypothetical protein